MPADLTPDLRDQVMALWFVDNIYANLPPEVALSAGHVAACALAARLAVPPAASEPSDEAIVAAARTLIKAHGEYIAAFIGDAKAPGDKVLAAFTALAARVRGE